MRLLLVLVWYIVQHTIALRCHQRFEYFDKEASEWRRLENARVLLGENVTECEEEGWRTFQVKYVSLLKTSLRPIVPLSLCPPSITEKRRTRRSQRVCSTRIYKQVSSAYERKNVAICFLQFCCHVNRPCAIDRFSALIAQRANVVKTWNDRRNK